MNRDPLFGQIRDRLEGELNHHTFELCAVDLLHDVYPGLAPIKGGSDAGMDGAVPDREGPPLPLISTTAKNVIGNLTRNLKRYKEEGGRAREAVVATSTKLTPQQHQRLHDRADELGFTLRSVHDGTDFALRLYRNTKWRRELLGLSGDLPALSTVAVTSRPSANIDLVGRDEILSKVRGADGDMVLVGQPGSGKTAVLQRLALDEVGLFIESEDMDRVANAVRELEPSAVFVDDAHRTPDLLLKLRRVREETGAAFRIVGTSWPADEDRERVLRCLETSPDAAIELPRLPRPMIADIVRSCGVQGPPRIIGEIVDQAAGLPGLAVTLARLSLQEGTRSLVAGDFLFRDLRQVLSDRLGGNVIPVLAAFSVGGTAGMPLTAVADQLQRPLDDIWTLATETQASGVLRQVGERVLAVEPEAFRWALVREVFFGESPALPPGRFFDFAPDLASSTITLSRAQGRGASVPDRLIQNLLERCGDPDPVLAKTSGRAWQSYAWTGPDAVNWILDQHPEHAERITRPALEYSPRRMLPRLLHAAVGDDRDPQSNTEHPLRKIREWIRSGVPGRPEAVERRVQLLEALTLWQGPPADHPDIALHALAAVFDPVHRTAPTDPVSRSAVKIHFGYLTPDQLQTLLERWPEAVDLVRRTGTDPFKDLERTVHKLVFPRGMAEPLPDEVRAASRHLGARMLTDLARLEADSPGIVAWARRKADAADLDVDLPEQPQPEFEILYPSRDLSGNRQRQKDRQREEARELGRRWASHSRRDIAARLAEYEHDAERIEHRYPALPHVVSEAMAEASDDQVAWLEALGEADLSPRVLEPFVRDALDEEGALRDAWRLLIDAPRYRHLVVLGVIQAENPPPDLLSQAYQRLDNLDQAVEHMCLGGRLQEERARRILTKAPPEAARAAAEGLWRDPSADAVSESLWEDWRNAIVEHGRSHHVLQEVFQEHPDIALAWLLQQLDDRPGFHMRIDESLRAALQVLASDQREQLLAQLPPDFAPVGFHRHLIGGDVDLYESLLDRDDLETFHLHPLRCRPNERWCDLAKVALDAGYDPADVAEAAFLAPMSFTGKESAVWAGWVEAFRSLEDATDSRLREAGRIGRTRAEAIVEQAEKREHREAVRGIVR